MKTKRRHVVAQSTLLLLASCALFPTQAEVCGPLETHPARVALDDTRRNFSDLPDGIRAIDCEAALCWAIPLDPTLGADAPLRGEDVVLIDTGIDPAGERLLASLAGARVVAVWVTHGHIDHWAAAHLFEDDTGAKTEVFVPHDDIAFMSRKKSHRALLPKLGQGLLALPPLPENLRGYRDRDILRASNATHEIEALAIHLPGHTPGSSAFLYKETLFSGDSLVAPQVGGVCAVPGFLVTDDEVLAWRSLRKLRDHPFALLLDGNYGQTRGAAALLSPSIARWRRQSGR